MKTRIFNKPNDVELSTGCRTSFYLKENNTYIVNVFSRKTLLDPFYLKPLNKTIC